MEESKRKGLIWGMRVPPTRKGNVHLCPGDVLVVKEVQLENTPRGDLVFAELVWTAAQFLKIIGIGK